MRYQQMRSDEPRWNRYFEKTSLLPFKAIFEGRNTFEIQEIQLQPIVLSLLLTGVIYWLRLRGPPPPFWKVLPRAKEIGAR
jgi:hypothetical protein